ncbi:MAG: hypothetical protein GXZ02_03765 [Clostridiales bacterium]|nr:hypothetical protein [Clostridiales bacterium]
MKRLTKKSLSVLLAVILATSLFVPAFANGSGSDDITYFSVNIDYRSNQLTYAVFAVEGYSVFNEDTFACTLYDSLGYEVFDETMADVSHMLPEDIDFEEVPDFVWVDIYLNDTVILNPDETYTFVVAAGSFSTAERALSPELTVEFLASDYIYIPTIWDHILSFLHSNIFFEFIFARVIRIIEFFYYNPLPIFPFPVG